LTAPIAESWAKIRRWLEENAPETAQHINPPAEEAAVAKVEEAMGRPLPAELREWLAVADGTKHRHIRGMVIPTLFNLLSCEEMLKDRDVWFSVYGVKPRSADTEAAGTPSVGWLTAFLPIAEAAVGLSLFIDLRVGESYGCISAFDPEDGGSTDAPRWAGVADMLEDVAAAMVDGRPALQTYADGATWPGSRIGPYLPEVIDDGYLHWVSPEDVGSGMTP
jgi:cell wall assembly regulator SMI1